MITLEAGLGTDLKTFGCLLSLICWLVSFTFAGFLGCTILFALGCHDLSNKVKTEHNKKVDQW